MEKMHIPESSITYRSSFLAVKMLFFTALSAFFVNHNAFMFYHVSDDAKTLQIFLPIFLQKILPAWKKQHSCFKIWEYAKINNIDRFNLMVCNESLFHFFQFAFYVNELINYYRMSHFYISSLLRSINWLNSVNFVDSMAFMNSMYLINEFYL